MRSRPVVLIVVFAAALGVFALLRWSGASLDPAAISAMLRTLGEGRGVWRILAPVLLVVLLAALLVVPVLPALLFQVGSGLAFGPAWGFVYVMLADALGATLGWWLARRWGFHLLRRWLKPHTVERVEGLACRLTWQAIILLRLLPGPAYPLVSFAAGLSPLSFRRYLAASLAGVAPSLALLVFAGEVAATSWTLAILLVVVFVGGMALAGRLLRRDPAQP